MLPAGVGGKAEVFLRRSVDLARYLSDGDAGPARPREARVTVADLAALWQASPRSVRETLARLKAWSLLAWRGAPGRGRRSSLRLLVDPVHVYFARAERAAADGRLAEAAFWYGEILADCPCIEGVPERLAAARRALGLAPRGGAPDAACCETALATLRS